MTQAVSITDALASLSPADGRVVLMCGLAGSGKTTFSTGLAARGFERLSIDEEVWERFGRYGLDYPPGAYDGHLSAARASLAAKLDDCLRDGRAAVVDSAFWSRAHRDEYKARSEAAGRPWALVHMKTPEAVLRARLAVRAERFDANAALPIDETTFGRFLQSFQEPVDEGQITVAPG
ncbi:hypothetical protein BH10PSE5_BH10PSE5_03750 [soil metagenome]